MNKLSNDVIDEKGILRSLIFATGLIILLNIGNEIAGRPFWQITRFISVGMENNFPTWYTSFIFIIAAFYAYRISHIVKDERIESRVWLFFSIGFLALSCDETASIFAGTYCPAY